MTRLVQTAAHPSHPLSHAVDGYGWLDVHILDVLCELGRRHGRTHTRQWVDEMRRRASRTGMRELTVRALLHSAALGNQGDADVAAVLALDIDNPRLASLVATALRVDDRDR